MKNSPWYPTPINASPPLPGPINLNSKVPITWKNTAADKQTAFPRNKLNIYAILLWCKHSDIIF